MTAPRDFEHDIISAIERDRAFAGFRLTAHHTDEKSFGDALVEFEDGECAVRFLRDRGQVFVDVANRASGRWWPMHIITESVHDDHPELTTEAVLAAFKRMYPKIRDRFQDAAYPAFAADLERIAEKRGKKIFGS